MRSIESAFIGMLFSCAVALPASAVTFTFDAELDYIRPLTSGAPEIDLSEVGRFGSLILKLTDPFAADLTVDEGLGAVSAWTEIGGLFLTFDSTPSSPPFLDERSFSTGGRNTGTLFTGGDTVACCDAFSSATFRFGDAVTSAPTLYLDLLAALADPGVTGYASGELLDDIGEDPSEDFTPYAVGIRFAVDIPVVPIPATFPLLVAGIGSLTYVARRRKHT